MSAPVLPKSAELYLIGSLSRKLAGKKIRIVGRVAAVDPASAIVVLQHGTHAVQVDLSDILVGNFDGSEASSTFLPDLKQTLMIMAYIELSDAEWQRPLRGTPTVQPGFVLRAMFTKEVIDFDWAAWEEALALEESTRSLRTAA
ncbi:uncharacterized protein L969DRAFT_18772 [Mixia osmundae IAM 14324]|uniref:CST complex subunit Stn1 N-terminal domain-containing protein n=1 Tax=Mixia osmundae (strain CBS 9802 / IAM 14324 / JCM 22182 / KY 12970) TaxID=764103 RepID=G7DSG4_MIXOS|nr:uncharacterized protein L969DRAFT_18772 [Mixia osmundae IAM 14324]KEI37981.1 hypothetical protein L969DRAFT_18772 [Mixia osmundae IAM 14324]GAA93524.1 hypothetical protein E5Q_00165 [Mixia osmundae IAM 14324]